MIPIADILFGRVNPSGRLPVSIPQSAGHLPCTYDALTGSAGFWAGGGSAEKPGGAYVFSTTGPDPDRVSRGIYTTSMKSSHSGCFTARRKNDLAKS